MQMFELQGQRGLVTLGQSTCQQMAMITTGWRTVEDGVFWKISHVIHITPQCHVTHVSPAAAYGYW